VPLNPPQVGRLSVCSTTAVIQHQLAGAHVALHLGNGQTLDLGVSAGVFEEMKLPPGTTLTRDDRVLATQSLGGETSPPSIPAIVEGTGPTASLPRPHPDSHIYACAGNVALDGMTPGTRAEILIGGQVVGSRVAPEGAVIVELSTRVPPTGPVQARANTCNLAPVTVTLPRTDPTPLDASRMLPAPRFGSAVMECVTWLRIDGVVPGATVILTRGDGSQQRWSFATQTWLVPLARPLAKDEPLVLRQDFPLCEIRGHETTATAGHVSLGKPKLTTPWCSGRVIATDLVPGATVVFLAENGTELGRSAASGTTCAFTLIQPTTARFFARQELCGVVSGDSNHVLSGNDPDLVDLTHPKPVIVEPVHACQTAVHVTGQVKGGPVEIWSHMRGMIGWRHSIGSESTVSVSALLDGEPIEAHAVSCAGQEGRSPVATATQATLHAPAIDVPKAGATAVTVHAVAISANLTVYVDGTPASTVLVDKDPMVVPVAALTAGQGVSARQYLCGRAAECENVQVQAAPAPPPPPQVDGISKVLVYNCNTEHRTVNVWNLDRTTGSSSEAGSLDADYDDFGTCPAFGEPIEIELEDGHLHEIVIVDPGAILCDGHNDPLIAACRRNAALFKGASGGPSFVFEAT
jgi:hypothetical protein